MDEHLFRFDDRCLQDQSIGQYWVHIELDNKIANCQSGDILSGHVYLRIDTSERINAEALTLSLVGLE